MQNLSERRHRQHKADDEVADDDDDDHGSGHGREIIINAELSRTLLTVKIPLFSGCRSLKYVIRSEAKDAEPGSIF